MNPTFRWTALAAALCLFAVPLDVAAQTRPRAYSLDDVLRLLRRGTRPARVVSMAQASCITFTVDRAAILRLRAAGATGGVITGLRSACVAPTESAARTVTAPPPVVPPATAPVRTTSAQPRAEASAAPAPSAAAPTPMRASPAALNALASHAVTAIGFETHGYLDGTIQRGRLYDRSYYDYVIFDATAGDSLRITMRSSDFIPYFSFGRALDCDSACSTPTSRFRHLAAARVRGDSATVDVRIPATGPYALRVMATGRTRGRTGEYSLRITRQ